MTPEGIVRGLVEDEYVNLRDDDWDWLTDRYFRNEEPVWDVMKPEVMAEELINELAIAERVVRRLRPALRSGTVLVSPTGMAEQTSDSQGTSYPRVPEWWKEHSRKVMEENRTTQQIVWSYLERNRPLALAEVEGFLHAVQQLERKAGMRRMLVFPAPQSQPDAVIACEMEVRSGWTRAELREAGFGRDGFGDRAQPLTNVARIITSLAERTGCSEGDVSAFLLCDVPLRLPWVDYAYVSDGLSGRIAPAIVITIGTPEVPADDVRRAYLFARNFLREFRAKEHGGEIRRRSRGTTWELVAFVEQRRPTIRWSDIFDEWSAEYLKGEKGFHSTMESMRAAYYRAPMRRGKETP